MVMVAPVTPVVSAPAASPPADARLFVGVDVSKARLDLCGLGRSWSVPNDAAGVRRVVAALGKEPPRLVVVESTGGYETGLLSGLPAPRLPVARVTPLRARRHAQARGVLAKTDRIDAAVLADFGHKHADTLRPMAAPGDNARM